MSVASPTSAQSASDRFGTFVASRDGRIEVTVHECPARTLVRVLWLLPFGG